MFHEVVEVRVVPGADGRDIVYAEFLTHFWLQGDNEDIIAPRFFVWTIGEAEDSEGTDGWQFMEVRVFWDTGILGRYVTEKNKKRKEKINCPTDKPMLMIQ